MLELYEEILTTQGKLPETRPVAIATDFCRRDAKGLKELIKRLYGEGWDCDILQANFGSNFG